MVSSDTVVGIVGAVVLTGAMIAVFYYENSNANGGDDSVIGEGDNVYTVQWAEETHAAEQGAAKFEQPDTLNEGASETYDVTIWNYTSVITVSLMWDDDESASELNAEDTFRVELLDPTGKGVANDEDESGGIALTYTVPAEATVAGEPVQKIVTARGNTTEEAELAVKEAAGSAQYQLRVTLVDTNSQVPDPLAGTAGDAGNSFQLYLGYTHWHAWEQSRVPAAQ